MLKGPPKIFRESFRISLKDMRKIMKDFHSEMEKGLSGEPSSLNMIPAYVDRPTGKEKGRFIALDLGGTNFRILELELKGGGRSRLLRVRKFVLKKKYLTAHAGELFKFLADCIKAFVKREKKEPINLGFTFSFPIKQTAIDAGILLRWTKGFDIKGVIGEDVVSLLKCALERAGVNNVTVSALANDTIGTLVAKSYEDPDCDIGIIIGTGTNACYCEKISNIKKWQGQHTPSGRMIVNIEWGNFNKIKMTKYDSQLDKASDRPGHQILEKMVSGLYLGEIARLILKDLTDSPKFVKKWSFKTEYMSKVESSGIKNLSKEGRSIKEVCNLVSLRASRITASAMAAIVTKIDPVLSGKHTIAIDGSVYEKHPTFAKNIRSALQEIFGKSASKIKIILTKDGSGRGAAIIAAVASS